eukprot:4534301-Amphidinium_carterae.1
MQVEFSLSTQACIGLCSGPFRMAGLGKPPGAHSRGKVPKAIFRSSGLIACSGLKLRLCFWTLQRLAMVPSLLKALLFEDLQV